MWEVTMSIEFDYFVELKELNPTMGDNRFAAKVPYVVKNPGKNFERIYPPLHEWWGRTREEAESKARAEANTWIEKQKSS